VTAKRTRLPAALLILSIASAGSAYAQTGSSTIAPPAPPPAKTVRRRAPPPPPPPPAQPPPSAPLDEVLRGKDKTGTPEKPPTEEILGPVTSTIGDDRPRPNYDGREEDPVSAGEALIWIPRVIFFPVHLVFEYLLRWPLVGALTWAEEVYLFKRIEEFFTWRDGKSGVYPTFFADFGLKPSVGLTTFHHDFPFTGNSFTAGIGWWYPNWFNVRARNRTTVLDDDSGKFDIVGTFVSRPDFPFYGVGSNTSGEVNPPFRYDQRYGGGGLAFLAALGGLSRFAVYADYRFVDFEDEPDVEDFLGEDEAMPLLPRTVCGGTPANPTCIEAPGFLDFAKGDRLARYHMIDSRIELKLDTRDPDREFKGGTGVLVEIFGGFSFSPAETSLNFIRYGGELAGFYDFTDLGHVLALRLHTELLVRTGTALRAAGNREIPFTELASLGGIDTMRGYLAGRFLGDSTLDMTLSYRYPVWSILDAEIFAGVGNAFEGHYGIDEGFDGSTPARFSFERLFFNAGIGLRTTFARDSGITLLLAFGTNRFDGGDGDGGEGLELDSVRFAFGFVEGF
jgi:hypothetical protein